ncbi:MAG: DUF192 domain-containing protein [Candidatus Azambacteria bacterium]|nr:DUF192 domain-containing protein [Candidatus Azambacteria bacterium]
MLVDSKGPFYWISGILIISLAGVIFYFQYQKNADKNSITIFTAIRPIKIQVEFAQTAQELETGLMNRDSLETNSGMFFVFPDEKPRNFWMKDTLIPLDMIFISKNGRVNEITTQEPCPEIGACPIYESKSPARYVLEINAGQAEKWNMSAGDIIEIPKF